MKLAIVGPAFFGYLGRLADHAKSRGIDAAFIDERPSNRIFAKAFYRFMPRKIVVSRTEQHRDSLCQRILDEGYTHILLVVIEILSPDDIDVLRSHGLRILLYTWDSLLNRPYLERYANCVSAIASFDPVDCEVYGFSYVPLYSDMINHKEDLLSADQRENDFFFCGTAHSVRPLLLARIKRKAQEHGWKLDFRLYYFSRLFWFFHNLSQPNTLTLMNEVSNKPIGRKTLIAAMRNTHVCIDIQHFRQTGLTMRTFEALSLGCILLTTNDGGLKTLPDVLRQRVVVLDPLAPEKGMNEALSLAIKPLDPEFFYTISINRFLDQCLERLDASRPDVETFNNCKVMVK